MKPHLHVAFAVAAALSPAGMLGGYLLVSSADNEPQSRAGRTDAAAQTIDGARLYAETCASCHGARLEGQPGWQRRRSDGRLPAPPHDVTGHTWHHGDEALFRITKLGPSAVVGGGYRSDMPAFEAVLSDDEIRAVLAYIKSTWPERQRAYQNQQTRRERESAAR
jgi:mono/diheme cytochrome c family protein